MNLPTAAHALRKPGKRDAQRALLDIAHVHPELVPSLAPLYTYFMPSRKKKPKTDFDWVALAVPKKDARRPYLGFVHVTADHVEATDGHRLHRVPNAGDLPAGNYLANGDRVDDPDVFGRWPDTDALISPPVTVRDPYTLDTSAMEIVKVLGCHAYVTPMGAGVRVTYLEQAMDGIPSVTALASSSSGPMLLEMGDRTAVIMPTMRESNP